MNWLYSLAVLLVFAQEINGQQEKTPSMWNEQQVSVYPNPIQNDQKCKTDAPIKRICDPNEVLDSSLESAANDGLLSLENRELKATICSKSKIVVAVALMRSIGPDVANLPLEAERMANIFHRTWQLNNCSAVLVVSDNDKISHLTLGTDIGSFLKKIQPTSVKNSSEVCFQQSHFTRSLQETVECVRGAIVTEIDLYNSQRTEEQRREQEQGGKSGTCRNHSTESLLSVFIAVSLLLSFNYRSDIPIGI